uniref:CCHC-type domain-containing protein n=1 Tax=Amphiprion ocellaris TaxID=80972 RepID=A0A3Q1B749_AMPOC
MQWSVYTEQLEQFFEANDIAAGKHVATLLSVMVASTYGLLRNLVQPDKPKDKIFDEIVAILKRHFEPKPLLVAERFRFNRCNQKANQSVALYMAELKQYAMNCEFRTNIGSTLRDRLVSGIRNEACMDNKKSRAASVHKVKQKGTKACYRCKGKNHLAKECHFKETKCHNCGKIGHIKKACRAQTQTEGEKVHSTEESSKSTQNMWKRKKTRI